MSLLSSSLALASWARFGHYGAGATAIIGRERRVEKAEGLVASLYAPAA